MQKDLEERVESPTEVDSGKEAFEAVLLEHKHEIEVLKGAMASAAKHFEVELAHRDLEIDKCKHELEVVSEKYFHDKSTLEDEHRRLQGHMEDGLFQAGQGIKR
ncbi:protein NETWORKED 4B-like isoform X1 [Panicum miliaceum]|uniref:Protein NETWORKED 4B-like isoform X1 n=1 Tax=Panicum miliaceum TaxID=4540 RepID=A0A3L6RCB5_PANMI|nr:protein NETWORKED 4B-like isoform X1 [Panicum miliaceum]